MQLELSRSWRQYQRGTFVLKLQFVASSSKSQKLEDSTLTTWNTELCGRLYLRTLMYSLDVEILWGLHHCPHTLDMRKLSFIKVVFSWVILKLFLVASFNLGSQIIQLIPGPSCFYMHSFISSQKQESWMNSDSWPLYCHVWRSTVKNHSSAPGLCLSGKPKSASLSPILTLSLLRKLAKRWFVTPNSRPCLQDI